MNLVHRIQRIMGGFVILTVLTLLPVFHYLGYLERLKRVINDEMFILEDISTSNLPDEVYFLSENILNGNTGFFIDGRKAADIFIMKQGRSYYLGIKWIKSYTSDYFSDTSFWLKGAAAEDTSGQILVGDVQTPPYKYLFVRYKINNLQDGMGSYQKLVLARNYNNEVLAEYNLTLGGE